MAADKLKVNFVCEFRDKSTGISNYAANMLRELSKLADVEKKSIEVKMIPKSILRLSKRLGFDLETTWKNYPLYINFKAKKRDREGIWHFSHQQQAFLLNYIKIKKSVITVHDIIPIASPYKLSSLPGQILFRLASRSIKKASRVIADSEHTKKDIVKYLGYPAEKIDVVYLGIDRGTFKKRKVKKEKKFTVLYVGSEMPRKNVKTLLLALEKVKDVRFVKCGQAHWPGAREELVKLAKELNLDFDFKDYVEDLAAEYNKADLVVMPSFYEGFGFPVLEAMACGCPVVCSSATSLPELAGDAALIFNPNNVDELTEKIKKVKRDKKLREKLIKKGFERVKKFTWKNCAKETIKVYRLVK